MDNHEKRKYQRDGRFAGKPVEAIIEDGEGYTPIAGAVLINLSDGGMQVGADINPNLVVGKAVVLFSNDGLSSKKRIETVIVWMSENDGKVRLGCEFTYPIVGMHF